MKKTIVLFVLLATTTLSTQDKYDQFIQRMNIQNQMQSFVDKYINTLASQSNGITPAQWDQIKYKIDYSPYFLGIKTVLMNNYTTAELDEIVQANDIISPVNDTGQFSFKPKPEIRKRVAETAFSGNAFLFHIAASDE